MNSSIQIFNNNEFSVRTTKDDDGTIWFVTKDIAQALGYSESSIAGLQKLIAHVPEIWKGMKRIQTPGGEQDMICLTEQGVYFFLGRSDKLKALPYQMWIAGDVVPSIRETGSYSIFKDNPALPSGVIEGAKIIFDVAGITGNQCALALDRVYRSYTGRSALDTGNITLTAPTNNQLLTPTEIGRRFGLKAKRVNQILAGAGFQHKVNDTWEAIGRGNEFAVMVDVGKKHGKGTAVRQLKWDSSILDVFDELRKED
ncbi:MAG: hypothetical protein IJQ77_02175 [Synergistaceae bacterium]|nr:hypothetical protein [Synergistaceae bacterium]